jgi:death-on-curing protein
VCSSSHEHSIVSIHALVDGKKRLGLLAAVVFLDINGETLDLNDEGAFDLVIAVAAGRIDVEEIAHRLGGRRPNAD